MWTSSYILPIQNLSVLQVNKDFGSIFSTLLPGATAKLAPPQGCGVLEGLEFKVALGTTWKENLSELSGGQRSGTGNTFVLLCEWWFCVTEAHFSVFPDHWWPCRSSWPCCCSNLPPSTSLTRWMLPWICPTRRTLDRCCAHIFDTLRYGWTTDTGL